MKREEAIKLVKSMPRTIDEQEALRTLIPELNESEDEQSYKRIEQLIRLNTSGAEKTHLLAYLEKQKEQKPAPISCGHENGTEWSEEDDVMLDKVCCLISPGTKLTDDNADYCVELKQWIISLRERILKSLRQQPKQEWSEEDEHRRQQAINALDRNGYYVLVDWLKSLCSQPHWKPSKEQMEYLYRASDRNNYCGAVLKSLYDDLKKLM